VSDHYLDVAAVSWNDKSAAAYFDRAEGTPVAQASCRKRINSQFIVAPSDFKVTKTSTGYIVTSSSGSRPNVPVALRFGSHAGVNGFDFSDNCADPGDTGANHVFYLVNGAEPMHLGKTYAIAVSPSSGEDSQEPQVVLLTPLSGVSVLSLRHHPHFTAPSSTANADPLFDVFTVYGPPGQSVTSQVSYKGVSSGWLNVEPLNTKFDASGTADFFVHYKLFSYGENNSAVLRSEATISIQTGGTGVVQTVDVFLK